MNWVQNLQIPTSKLQRNFKPQGPKRVICPAFED